MFFPHKSRGVIPLNISQYNQQKKYYQVKFPCGVITKGGKYGLRVHHEMFDFTEVTNFWSYNESFDMTSIISVETPSNSNITVLNVLWPAVSLTLEPQIIETYPEYLITATIMWQLPNESCQPMKGSRVPDTWLNLISCGQNAADCIQLNTNQTHYRV
ncbi:hypothetical protein M8J77_013779 [Diaphorina citri]|nr:hypothetical protein M8J77_013779 [Diaphorina citri]